MTLLNKTFGVVAMAMALLVPVSACSLPGKSSEPLLSNATPTADIAPEASVHSLSSDEKPGSNTLYHALGGNSGIEKLSHQFIKEIAADNNLRQRFTKTDIGRFDRMFQEHVCELSDGPCSYSGDSMERVHGGMNIQSSEFSFMVQALMRAMDKVQLSAPTQNRLLAKLARLRPRVVGQ